MDNKPKLWKDMTPEEKGALLLAHHEGKDIEWTGCAARQTGGWDPWEVCDSRYLWDGEWCGHGFAYRVKPEPKREKVTAQVCLTTRGFSLHMRKEDYREKYGKAHLYATFTFDTIDGKPDPKSLKIEGV
jgi:hypothetical protein